MKPIHFLLLLCAASAGPLFAGDSKPAATREKGPDAAHLWAQNCSRCHNIRPAVTYSDAQWDVIVHHMQVRAFLTGSEARAIAEFLKDAN